MKLKAILSTFLILWTFGLIANISQPGIRKAGGGISLLLPQDSLASKYIKMSSERVDLFVFSGFGIVHGQYTLINTSDESVSFTMGYPINALWRGEADRSPFGYSFQIDSLAGFEVTLDGSTEIIHQEILSFSNTTISDNWIVWKIDFDPGQTQVINVTYTTPTAQAKVSNLRGQRSAHGLIYIFESGAVWKDKIDKADLFVHFMDGLTTEDVIGIRPCDQMHLLEAKDILYFNKSNWEPEPGENFYLLYQSRKNKYYSFPEGVQDRNQLYSKIQKKGKEVFQVGETIHLTCQDILDIDSKSPYTAIVFSILGGSLLLFILLIYIIIKLVKK